MKLFVQIPLLVATLLVFTFPFAKPMYQPENQNLARNSFLQTLVRRENEFPKRSMGPRYTPLCEVERRRIDLDTNLFSTSFYIETICKKSYDIASSEEVVQKCGLDKSQGKFHCVQQYTDIYVLQTKSEDPSCLQPVKKTIPSGCECMWPVLELIE